MRVIAFILCFFILVCNVKSETKLKQDDTTKFVPSKYDIKPAITKELAKCFTTGEFKSSVIFFNSSVEFSIKKTDRYEREIVDTETLTEYGAIQKLTDVFKSLKYTRFKIFSGKNILEENVLMVEIFLYKDNDDLVINIYFILNSNNEIKKVVIV